jgi:hypothetical protein
MGDKNVLNKYNFLNNMSNTDNPICVADGIYGCLSMKGGMVGKSVASTPPPVFLLGGQA